MAMVFAQPTERSQTQPPTDAVVFADCPLRAFARLPFGKSPFGGFKLEHESAILIPQHTRNSRLEQILGVWKQLWPGWPHVPFDKEYSSTLHAVSGINCSAADLIAFMKFLIPESLNLDSDMRFPIRFGMFISALINDGSGDAYTVDTSPIDARIHFLGYRNRKNVRVIGNAGGRAGDSMEGGTLVITGNADILTGCGMRGGKIIVRGNCGGKVGSEMTGGEIHILGRCEGIASDISGGKIFVQGVQAYPRLVPEVVLESVPVPEAETRLE